MNRIFDMPNHSHYGAARRLFVVFQTLFADHLMVLDQAYQAEWGTSWDQDLSHIIAAGEEEQGVMTQVEAQREITDRAMCAIELWYAP